MIRTVDAVGGKAVQVASQLGLFEALETSPHTIQSLAKVSSCSERGMRSLLYLLASMGLLKQDGEMFLLGEATPNYLEKEWPDVHRELPQSPDWENLEEAVRTGRCVRPAIEGESDGGDFFSGVVDTLFGFHWPLAQALAQELPDTLAHVLDLGAGSAVWSLALVVERPEIRAVAVDHAKVLDEMTKKFVSDKKVAERYELRPGSYHEVELEHEHYDIVYLGHIVHSEGWEASRSLLKRCLETLKPGGYLAIAEWLGSEPREKDYHANLFDLNMLMFTEKGLVFSRAELEEMVSTAGFDSYRWVTVPGKYPVLLAQKAT